MHTRLRLDAPRGAPILRFGLAMSMSEIAIFRQLLCRERDTNKTERHAVIVVTPGATAVASPRN